MLSMELSKRISGIAASSIIMKSVTVNRRGSAMPHHGVGSAPRPRAYGARAPTMIRGGSPLAVGPIADGHKGPGVNLVPVQILNLVS